MFLLTSPIRSNSNKDDEAAETEQNKHKPTTAQTQTEVIGISVNHKFRIHKGRMEH